MLIVITMLILMIAKDHYQPYRYFSIVNCVIRTVGGELVYHTITVSTVHLSHGNRYSRGKTAIFPVPDDDISEYQELQ